MFNIIQLIKYRLPLRYKNVWWNGYAMSKKFWPKIFDDKGDYIECEIGVKIPMIKLKDNKVAIYKVTKKWCDRPNSDWLYPSDCINCNLIFSHVENQLKHK